MALPSPCFVTNSIKSEMKPEAVKSHVPRDGIENRNHFIAYCKYCREGFKNENELFQHRKSHERCPYNEGCQFNASAKVVADHIQRVHLKTNTLVKIQDLTTPEQIEKWREERRKRYPTTANVVLRQQAQEIRFQRGEKLQDRQQRFGDFQQRNHIRHMDNRNQRGTWNRPNHQHHRSRSERHQNQHFETVQKDENMEPTEILPPVEETQESAKPVNTFKPREPKAPEAAVLQPEDEDSSDDENKATPRFKGTAMMKDYHEVETIVKEKAALSLLGMYGSDSDNESDSNSNMVAESAESTCKQIDEVIEDAIDVDEEEVVQENDECDAPDEVPIAHNSEMFPPDINSASTDDKLSRKRKRVHQPNRRDARMTPRSVLDYSKLRHKPSVNPFLEKLLQEDIRHERNVLLQCVNYVVKNNFFDADDKVMETATVKEHDDSHSPATTELQT